MSEAQYPMYFDSRLDYMRRRRAAFKARGLTSEGKVPTRNLKPRPQLKGLSGKAYRAAYMWFARHPGATEYKPRHHMPYAKSEQVVRNHRRTYVNEPYTPPPLPPVEARWRLFKAEMEAEHERS